MLLINVAVYALQLLGGDALLVGYFALWPIDSGRFQIWQVLTYGFLHDPQTVLHLLFNMFTLWNFGADVERTWGRDRFLTYYIVCVLAAGLTQLVVGYLLGSEAATLGASGGVFGVLLAFGMLFPHRKIVLIFPLPIQIPLPVWLVVTVFAVLELFMGVTGAMGDVAHFAHLGGMLGGYLLIRYGRSRR